MFTNSTNFPIHCVQSGATVVWSVIVFIGITKKGKAVQAYLREKLSSGSILSEINNKNQLRFLSQKS